jgi:hypothetical protein
VKGETVIKEEGEFRTIQANGIPDHKVGPFPGPGNPNAIAPQSYQFRIPLKPQPAKEPVALQMQDFGIAVNGVPFDPGAAEWYLGNREGGWRYEPLSGAIRLGIDSNHAHVQPTGAYHYHGLPTSLLDSLKLDPSKHSALVGWAADGFPIYAMYGYENPKEDSSPVKALKSSYQLRKGKRPEGAGQPGGVFDGTFVQDYEYIKGAGDLDECNGRWTVTPEFPSGTYAYFLTENWPVIPRMFRGTPSPDFQRKGPPRGGGRNGPPPPPPPPPR